MKKILFWIYKQTWILALLWIIIVLLLTLKIDYNLCLNKAPWMQIVFKWTVIIFTLQASIIIIFSFYQKYLIDKNIKIENNELDGLDMLDEPKYSGKSYIGSAPNKLFILPLYIIMIYSISKIIIITVKGSPTIHSNEYFYMIWGALLIFSGGLWFLLQKYADDKNKYSIKYTLIVIILTLLSIYWKYAVPYLVDIIEVFKCVFSTMIEIKGKI